MDRIPDTLRVHILSFVSLEDVCRARAVCKFLSDSKSRVKKVSLSRINQAFLHKVCMTSSVKILEAKQVCPSQALFAPFQNLESLCVYRCAGFKVEMLPPLPNLRALRIEGTTFPGMLQLPFPKLEHLQVNDCGCIFTDSQIVQWRRLDLRTLSLSYNTVWNVDFSAFRNLVGLRAPLFHGDLRKLPLTLRVLDLSCSRFYPDSLLELKHLERLRKLVLDFVPLGDSAVVHLRTFSNLRHLSLVSSQVTPACFGDLATLPLETLGLASTAVQPKSALGILRHFHIVMDRQNHDIVADTNF